MSIVVVAIMVTELVITISRAIGMSIGTRAPSARALTIMYKVKSIFGLTHASSIPFKLNQPTHQASVWYTTSGMFTLVRNKQTRIENSLLRLSKSLVKDKDCGLKDEQNNCNNCLTKEQRSYSARASTSSQQNRVPHSGHTGRFSNRRSYLHCGHLTSKTISAQQGIPSSNGEPGPAISCLFMETIFLASGDTIARCGRRLDLVSKCSLCHLVHS